MPTDKLKNTWKRIKVKEVDDGPLYSSQGSLVGEKWTDYFSDEEVKEIKIQQKKK